MSQQRPKLADLKRVCPQDLAHCEGYVWHLGSRIGKGSFGEVFLGWTSDGKKEVAVKVVRKEFFKQDPKVRENLEREIRILKLLRGCEYVVHLFHVQELKQCIVLVMELCEYDLDHLVKIQPFKENDTITFLYQLAEGMKALREQNIVHRDLKPGNILIKTSPRTGKMMIKLADFGFARHFKDEGMKPIDMTSLAGTPVFMAPEALRCVFHPGEHYDDKVDIWSIGALLYKVLVGQCGFYAQLQDILRILKHKGDAIAFERVPHSRKINYVNELPPSVNGRLSEPFKEKMDSLLKAMLKLEPIERMTFIEFFAAVDDIITSKIEIVNLLHGTSFKIMNDPNLTVESLTAEVQSHSHVPTACQIIFTNKYPQYIASHTKLTQEAFAELLDKAGGSKGYAVLYLLTSNQLDKEPMPVDFNCLSDLKMALEEPNRFVSMVVDHKFVNDIVHIISNLLSQQKRQLEGLQEFCQFCNREVSFFTKNIYHQLNEQGHQALARANLALQWLQQDLSSLGGPDQERLQTMLKDLAKRKDDMDILMKELGSFKGSGYLSVSLDLREEDLIKSTSTLSEEAKKLPKIRRDYIHPNSKAILEDCQRLTSEVTTKIRNELRPLYGALSQVWGISQKSTILRGQCVQLEALLSQVLNERSMLLSSMSKNAPIRDKGARASPTTPPVVVTPPVGGAPGVWPHPPGSFYAGPPPPVPVWGGQQDQQGGAVEGLRKNNESLKSKVSEQSQEIAKLTAELTTLRRTQRNSSSSIEEEQTIRPGQLEATLQATSPSGSSQSLSSADNKTLQSLTEQLALFCSTAEKLKPGISSDNSPTVPPKSPGSSKPLYPDLLDDYTVIGSLPGTNYANTAGDISTLMPQAKQLAELLKVNIDSIKTSAKGTVTLTANSALIKIGKPDEYNAGDIVLFHPVRLIQSKTSAPVVMHLDRPKPYILLDLSSYNAFNIRPGRIPDVFLGKLTQKPRQERFETVSNKDLAADIGETSGFFYRVRAEPIQLKFSPQRPLPPTALSPTDKKPRTASAGHHPGGLRGLLHKKGREYI